MSQYSNEEQDLLGALMDDGKVAVYTAWGFLLYPQSWEEVHEYHTFRKRTLNKETEHPLNVINRIIIIQREYI